MRSNVGHWKTLQNKGYFEKHGYYSGLTEKAPDEAVTVIKLFQPLAPDAQVVVIGCGYGRESLGLCRNVSHVFGIDVSPIILDKAVKFLGDRSITNFTPVLAEEYDRRITPGIDLVFSIVVMQHLTRDLVRDYFARLGAKLNPGGAFIVQFLEHTETPNRDVDLSRAHEPAVSWTVAELFELAEASKLNPVEVRSIKAENKTLWHWAYFTR
jgi:cyclopropane fatty-acyl-phospholipid synthase-like methyltransferase